MEWFGWFKRVKPVGKKLLRICANPENELVELVKKGRNACYTKCELDSNTLLKILNIVSALMSTGKMNIAADLCKTIAEKCFDQATDNPYRLMFLSFAMVADCETRFYDLTIFQLNPQDLPLKLRYSLCHQASNGILEMEPTIFKTSELLTMCEELSHFSCFRQCHVNLLKNFAEIGEDENVDWFDRVKVLDSNILALINDSDIVARLCETDKEKKEFQRALQKLQLSSLESNDQYCFSWFNHLHFQEICVRSTAAIEVLKADPAYKTFVRSRSSSSTSFSKTVIKPKPRRRLLPQNPLLEAEEKAKRISFGEDSGVLADAKMAFPRKNSLTYKRPNAYSTDVEDMNYSIPIFENGKSFSDQNADSLKDKSYRRRERQRAYDSGGAADCRMRLPESVRRKIRMLLRKMMSEGREMQKVSVKDDKFLNLAFPVTDDECSDDEVVPKTFFRTETLETMRKKKMRKFGMLNPKSEAKPVLWWQNAKDELLATRAIANHCVKITGESSEPFATFEEYLGKIENGGKLRDRMSESNREANCRVFDLKKETNSDDGVLLTMPSSDPFKECRRNGRKYSESVGLNSFLLQNMRRRCIDELLILMMIIKGQQQLQDGNVIRCLAYLMLIEYKFDVFAERYKTSPGEDTNFYPYLTHLHKHLLAKFRLYSTDLFGPTCLTIEEEIRLEDPANKFDLNLKCASFCRSTKAYFFCICIRGKIVERSEDGWMWNGERRMWDRKEIEMQHEFFFSLDNANKNNHLNSFWRTECMPIVSGLVHMTDHSLVDKIDTMNHSDAWKILISTPGLSSQTKEWLKQVTQYGFLKQKLREETKSSDPSKNIVPMIFQLPSGVDQLLNTDDMVDEEGLEPIRRATTMFVREKCNSWKEKCKADKENLKKTNTDKEYDVEKNMTFFGEAIEKDVYMVVVYKGEKITEEIDSIASGMHSLCRQIRSQAGFVSIKKEHIVEDLVE